MVLDVLQAVAFLLAKIETDAGADDAAADLDEPVPAGRENQKDDAKGDTDQINFAAPEDDFFCAFVLQQVEFVGLEFEFDADADERDDGRADDGKDTDGGMGAEDKKGAAGREQVNVREVL